MPADSPHQGLHVHVTMRGNDVSLRTQDTTLVTSVVQLGWMTFHDIPLVHSNYGIDLQIQAIKKIRILQKERVALTPCPAIPCLHTWGPKTPCLCINSGLLKWGLRGFTADWLGLSIDTKFFQIDSLSKTNSTFVAGAMYMQNHAKRCVIQGMPACCDVV